MIQYFLWSLSAKKWSFSAMGIMIFLSYVENVDKNINFKELVLRFRVYDENISRMVGKWILKLHQGGFAYA